MQTAIFLSILVGWIGSVVLHEYAHARVALAGGDTSVIDKGYMSMNPMRYLHPVTSFVIPVLIMAIGGIPLPGGAVYIETQRLRSKHWTSAVSAAGPFANLLILVACALPFTLGLCSDLAAARNSAGWLTLAAFCYLQAIAVIINLLPIPPLDGFGVIEPYLSPDVRNRAREFGNLGFLILLVIFFTNNPIQRGIWQLCSEMIGALGVPVNLALEGLFEFQSILN